MRRGAIRPVQPVWWLAPSSPTGVSVKILMERREVTPVPILAELHEQCPGAFRKIGTPAFQSPRFCPVITSRARLHVCCRCSRTGERYLWRTSLHPKPEAASECISVLALTAALGHFLELLHIATAENNIVGLESCGQAFNNIYDVFAPFVLPVLLQTSNTDVVFVRRLAIRKMTKLHGL